MYRPGVRGSGLSNKGASARVRRAGLLWCTAAMFGGGVAVAQRPATGSAAVGAEQPPVAIDPRQDPGFDAALPPLDGMAAPPSAATIENQASTPAAASAPQTAVPDPALAQPLPPLAGFDPTPDTGKAAVPTAEDARIRYTVTVDGLDEIGLASQFKALSALRKGKKAANAAQVRARAEADTELAEKLMKSQGYYDGVATSTVLAVAGQPGTVAVAITATPGMRYDFATIAITGAPPEPTAIAREALPLRIGAPVVATDVIAGEANVGLILPQRGYPFARTGDHDIVIDDATHGADYTLPLAAGPRAVFGVLRTRGDAVLKLDHLDVFPRFDKGQRYDSRWTEDLRQALVGTSLFSSVAVEPIDTHAADATGDEIVDLMVTQNKGPWHAINGDAGYGTGQGIKADVSYTWRNLFPPEGALTLSAIGGTLEQGANAQFTRSNAGQRDRTFSIAGGFDHANFDAYNARTINLVATLARQSTPIWQKKWTWSVGVGLIETDEQGAAVDATDTRPYRKYSIAAVPLQLGYDTSDDLLNPTHGIRAVIRGGPEAAVHDGVRPYARVIGQVAGYYPIGASLVLAGRVLVGSILGIGRDDIAPSRRLYSGGGGSVRGYGYQELGPKDPAKNPIGGRDQTEFAVEARYRFGNFGVVPFFDAGRVGEGSTPGISNLRYGAGIGGRYYTNFGPLRVDVATPLNPQPGDSRITLYISIGQAF